MICIFGIDFGLQWIGVGIIDVDVVGCVIYVYYQLLVLLGVDDFLQCMKLLVLGLVDLCCEYQLQEVVIEKVFMVCNFDLVLKLGQVWGVVILVVVLCDLLVYEYVVSEIKFVVVGCGGVEK